MFNGRYYSMVNNPTKGPIPLLNDVRKLWSQHVYWTRMFVVSKLNDLADLEFVTNRLLRNPKDFGTILRRYYGVEKANQFEKLLTEHLTIAATLVDEAKRGNAAKMSETRKTWFKNADDIAKFLRELNPNWSQSDWKNMMYEHLMLLEREVGQILNNQHQSSISTFNEVENQALMMADEMSAGIIKQFELIIE